jgi:hypothetical protein
VCGRGGRLEEQEARARAEGKGGREEGEEGGGRPGMRGVGVAAGVERGCDQGS